MVIGSKGKRFREGEEYNGFGFVNSPFPRLLSSLLHSLLSSLSSRYIHSGTVNTQAIIGLRTEWRTRGTASLAVMGERGREREQGTRERRSRRRWKNALVVRIGWDRSARSWLVSVPLKTLVALMLK